MIANKELALLIEIKQVSRILSEFLYVCFFVGTKHSDNVLSEL